MNMYSPQRSIHQWMPEVPYEVWMASSAPTFLALDRPGYVAHAQLSAPIAEWAGLEPAEVADVTSLLTLLQVTIDICDNIADWHKDRNGPLETHRVYEGIPFATLAALPALYTAAVVRALHRLHPDGAGFASDQMMAVLATMATGQGLPGQHPDRIERISGQQGRLLLLPAWLKHDQDYVAERLPELEQWAVAYGLTWELNEEAQEHPTPTNIHRARIARREVQLIWPLWGPFNKGALAANRMLGAGMS